MRSWAHVPHAKASLPITSRLLRYRVVRSGLATVVALAATLGGACFDDAAGPQLPVTGHFALVPAFETALAGLVPLAEARITLTRAEQTAPVLDTVIPIQPGDTAVDLSLTVALLAAGETLTLNIQLITPAGDTAFRAGPIPVTPSTDPTNVPPIDIPLVYTGIGANAAGVRILTPDTTAFGGDAVTFVGEAFDDGNEPLPGTPIGWASTDPTKAQVPDEAFGLVIAGTERGTTQITATLLTGQADTVLLTVELPPAALVAESGSGQSEPPGSLLPAPLVARVTASDGIGVADQWVRFTVVAGGGTLSADSALTDATGRASVQWTLGQMIGSQIVQATTARLPGVTATFTATGQATEPGGITIVDGDGQSAVVGSAVGTPPTVRVTDPQGNPVPDVTVTFAVTGGGGTVTGATPVTDANGVAAVGSWVLGPAIGVNTLSVTAESLMPVVFTANATGPGGATTMSASAGDGQSALAGTAVAVAPTVLVTDAGSNPIAGVTVNFAVTAGGGSIEVNNPVTDASGIASVGTWTLGAVGSNTLTASLLGLPDVVFTATGTVGPPAAVILVSGDDQSADAGTTLPQPLVVEVQDAGGNPVPGVTVLWDSRTGSVVPATGTTDAAGRSQTVWTLGTGDINQSATATVAGLTPVVFTATAIFPNPTVLLALAGGTDRIVLGGSGTLDITLTAPAPVGGVVVDVTSDNPAVVAVETPVVPIPEGQTTGQTTLTGVAGGTSVIRGIAPGYTEGTLLVTVSVQVLSLPATLNVPLGGTASMPVQISTPAPAGGVDVTLVSSDPAAVGVLTPTVTIPEGLQTANGTVSGVSPGTATVTGTTTDFGTAQSTVSTTANLNIIQTFATINASFGTDITVQLESGGSAIAAPSPGVDVTLTPRDPTCVAATSPVTIPTGLVSTTSTLSYAGTATLSCTTWVVAEAPSVDPDSLNVTVNPAPGINLSGVTVGAGLQRFWSGSLGASNHGGVDVVVKSDNPAVAQVAPDASTAGTDSIIVSLLDGQTSFVYYVQGVEAVADTGTATTTFTVSAPGFTTNSATKTIVRPGLDISGLTLNTTTLSPDDPFVVRVGVPNAGLTFLNELQAIRAGGSPVTITVSSSDPLVGELVTTPDTSGSVTVQIGVGGTQSPSSVAAGGVAFDPLTAGSTTVTASNPAFATVTNGARTVTVSAPGINLSGVTVGAGLQRFWSGSRITAASTS